MDSCKIWYFDFVIHYMLMPDIQAYILSVPVFTIFVETFKSVTHISRFSMSGRAIKVLIPSFGVYVTVFCLFLSVILCH